MKTTGIEPVKYEAGNQLLYNGLYSLIASLLSLIFVFGINILTARLLRPEGKGEYDLVLATVSLLVIFLGWSLSSGITFVVARKPTAINKLIKILFILAVSQCVIAVVFLSVLNKTDYYRWFLPTKSNNNPLIYIIGLSLLFTSLNSYWRAIFLGYQEIVKASKFELVSKIVYSFLLLISAIVLFKIGYNASPILCLWLYIISLLATTLFIFKGLYPYLQKTGSSSNIREIISYSTTCYFANSFQFLNYRLDIFFVAYYSSNIADVGFYTLAGNLAQMIWLIPQSISTVILPKIVAENGINGENTKIITALTTRLVLWISLFAGLLMMLLFPLVVPIVFGKAFQGVIPPFMWLLPGVIAFSGTKILGAYIAGIGKPKVNLFFSFIGFLVTISLDILLIPYLGIVGAAIASSLSYIATTIGTILFLNNRLGFSWKDLLILNLKDTKMLLSKFFAIFSIPK